MNPYRSLYEKLVSALEAKEFLKKGQVLKYILKAFEEVDWALFPMPAHQMAMRGMVDAFNEIAMYDDLESDQAIYMAVQHYAEEESEHTNLFKDMLGKMKPEDESEAKREEAIEKALREENIENETTAGMVLYLLQTGLMDLTHYEEDIKRLDDDISESMQALLAVNREAARIAAEENDRLATRMLTATSVEEEITRFPALVKEPMERLVG